MKVNSGDLEVQKEDQLKINQFSRLNMHYHELVRSQNIKKDQISQLNDGYEEMELMEDDEKIQYRFGDSFFSVSIEKAQKLIDRQKSILQKQLEEISKQVDDTIKQMKNLKAKLYAKFGTQINLEDD
ncbi:hypothetical protein pb186bvf_003250 [Paramecium bursaria]